MKEEKRLYLWAMNPARESGACQEYRIKIPMRELDKIGYTFGYEAVGDNPRMDVQAQLSSDICQFYSASGENYLHRVKTLKDIKPGMLADGGHKYPPICIYDVDDNADFVHPFNETFMQLGVRHYPSGKLLTPGLTLEQEEQDGRRTTLAEDLVTHNSAGITFDIARNLHEMKIRHELIRQCHGATVSTPALASYFKEVIGQKNVYVFPNTIVPTDYEYFDVRRESKTSVRILWQGSPSHYVDWFPLRAAIREITEKYPQVKWVIYGWRFDWVHGLIPDDRIEFCRWTPYQAYKLRRGLLNIDINLCPLADNPFNRCKSAIKFYEGSIWKHPEATIAADVETYREIQDGKTGLLYKSPAELVQKIGVLIENAELRQSLGAAAKKWVLANRTPEHTIPGLRDFFDDTRATQMATLTPRIIHASR